MAIIYKVGMILLGALIYAVGLNAFTIANNLAEGGFTGIALLLYYLYSLPTGWTFLLLNTPLFLIAWRFIGKEFLFYTIIGTISVSVFIEITAGVRIPTNDLLLATLYSGVSTGLGLGIILRAGATTAGVDIIARIVRKYMGISLGKTIFFFDVVIIGVSAVILGSRIAMYSLVGLFIASRVVDFVQEGINSTKTVMIISDHAQEISARISKDMSRGTTLLAGRGGFTGMPKDVVLCAINRSEFIKLKNIIKEIDNDAFIIVNDAREILGEGFST